MYDYWVLRPLGFGAWSIEKMEAQHGLGFRVKGLGSSPNHSCKRKRNSNGNLFLQASSGFGVQATLPRIDFRGISRICYTGTVGQYRQLFRLRLTCVKMLHYTLKPIPEPPQISSRILARFLMLGSCLQQVL